MLSMCFKEEERLKWEFSGMQGFPGLGIVKLVTYLLCYYQALTGRVEGYLEVLNFYFVVVCCYCD